MHLYVALMTVSICVVSVMMQENNYGKYRALVLVRKSLPGRTKFHRPTSVTKKTTTDDDKNPYKYEDGWKILSILREVYFFCPPDEDTKLLAKNENAYCQFPIRTDFTDGGLKHFGDTGGRLIFNGYSYINPKNERTAEDSVYGFLYDNDEKRIYYIQYTIYSRNLLDSDEILAQEKDFITEPTSLIEERDFEYVKEGLDLMEKEMKYFPLEGRDQISNPQHDYYRATLASRFHFPFVQYKRPLFHYSNITLVHKDILKLFVETQIFISQIKMDKLQIFAVPYFHSEEKNTEKQDTQDTSIQNQDIILENIQKERNEKPRPKYAPDIIGYLIFDKTKFFGIAIILHNESESNKDNIKRICDVIKCKSYYQYLEKKQVDENILSYAYCCKVEHILQIWKLLHPFPGTVITSDKHFHKLHFQV